MTTLPPTLDQLRAVMRDRGVRRILVKFLSPNDNSKNQIYLGGDLGVINIIPAGDPVASSSGQQGTPIFKAPLTLAWIDDQQRAWPAPNAQLILYPQYPEVRMSGFLKGAQWAPSELLTAREEGRILVLGIGDVGSLFGYVADAASALAKELQQHPDLETAGVFKVVPLTATSAVSDSRTRLMAELCRIAEAGWIEGWTLGTDGSRRPCTAPNCVGVTLESELGITANGRSEPDFDGWEVKGHTVANLKRPGSGAVTLLTPEPNGGVYVDVGAIEFVRRFGYKDKLGREDRLNFGGIHRVGERCAATGLTMLLDGYDSTAGMITDSEGALVLVSASGEVAASWSFAGLMSHWIRKHARAVFVPALKRTSPTTSFAYGAEVLVAEGTDYLFLLSALARGVVYYDPGIKVENASTVPKAKRRSQFRVSRKALGQLYHSSENRLSCSPV